MKKTLTLLAVILTAMTFCGSCSSTRHTGAGSDNAADGKNAAATRVDAVACDSLTVISFNIRNGKAKDGDNDWNHRCPATKAMLETLRPDIFGVQEAYDYQVTYITENCPDYASFGVGRDDGVSQGEHMSIFYNKQVMEMIQGGTYWLSETPDVPSYGWDAVCRRTATWALLRDLRNGREFFFVNTHLDHKGWEARRRGLALIVEKIAAMNPDNKPMILTGDFNVTPDNDCLAELNTMMSSAREKATVSDTRVSYQGFGKSEGSIIDYIYYSGFSTCPLFRVVTETYADIPYISDHYPVEAILRW